MAKVQFTTKAGVEVRFQATGKRARGQKRPLSEYSKFIGARVRHHMVNSNIDAVAAFAKAVKEWNMAKNSSTNVTQQQRMRRQTDGAVMLRRALAAVKQQAPKKQAKKPVDFQSTGLPQAKGAQVLGSILAEVSEKKAPKQQAKKQAPRSLARDLLKQRAAKRRRAA